MCVCVCVCILVGAYLCKGVYTQTTICRSTAGNRKDPFYVCMVSGVQWLLQGEDPVN